MFDDDVLNYFSQKTLLIAEDHQPTQEQFQLALNEYFQNIITVSNGIECLENIKLKKPDLLIIDVKMPFKNGMECIESIRSIDMHIPIIVISAFRDEQYLLKAANLDIQGYLLKPLDLTELNNTLVKIVNLTSKNDSYKITSDMFYDPSNSMITYKNQEIFLTKKENTFLNLLIQNKDTLVSYQTIEYELWGESDTIMFINSLRTLVKKLRSKLPIDIIKNVSKTGYKFYLK